ncbi:hypothetical protein SCP_1200150 [Sparassis crispa]|uniref:Uncharacterized protein n=1 Tax=Sparassis crispa TaxID=139825 RepID=A0A401H051_9APHY|nr:hypothetical protein SCP_1200150 [Sparassis crispa]GBE87791.1 hypothetical protein SCP_1200150 [Sparassis crispa]
MKDETHQADSLEDNAPKSHPLKPATTVAERDADYVEKLKEREGSLANTEFEDGKIEEGLRRNVKANIFRYI